MSAELRELMMPGARFRSRIGVVEDRTSALRIDDQPVRFGPGGIDEVVFHVRTNEGEAEGSVADIASSGELSRIALALKKVASVGREGTVLVFDELDAGVGADLGEMLARKLSSLAERFQIVCITHLPQVAAAARRHLVVAKTTEKSRTYVHVHDVSDRVRVEEIARMLGGKVGSQKRLALAEEMLHIQRGKTPHVRP